MQPIVRPGSFCDLDVRFVGSGRLSCDTPMTITLNDALQAGTSKRAGYSIALLARDSNRQATTETRKGEEAK
jgi:hypothetical protein